METPPQEIEQEQAVFATIFLEPGLIKEFSLKLKPEYFYKSAHKLIFCDMLEMLDSNVECTVVNLTSELRRKKELESIGGVVYLSNLQTSAPCVTHLGHTCGQIKSHTSRGR